MSLVAEEIPASPLAHPDSSQVDFSHPWVLQQDQGQQCVAQLGKIQSPLQITRSGSSAGAIKVSLKMIHGASSWGHVSYFP